MVFLLCAVRVQALMVTEIMYDVEGTDADREWVEIFNDGESSVDLSQYRLNDGANHVLNAPPANGGQGSLTFPANSYAIIAANAETFLSEHPGFSGTVIDTVLSLTNTGDTVAMTLGGAVVTSHTYTSDDGGVGTGRTLQYIDGVWTESIASPGTAGTLQDDSEPSATETITTTSTTATSSDEEVSASEKERIAELRRQFTIDLLEVPKTGVAGATISLKAKVSNAYKEQYAVGRFVWSMGDGGSREFVDDSPFQYVYMYPGEYVVTIDFYKKNNRSLIPEKTARKTIAITAPSIRIASIDARGSVELVNDSSEERDIGGWMLSSNGTQFVFPRHTTVLAKKKIFLSGRTSALLLTPQSTLVLMNENGDSISSYGAVLPEKKTVRASGISVPAIAQASAVVSTEPAVPVVEEQPKPEIPEKKKDHTAVLGLVGIVVLGGGALIVSRRFRTKSEVVADDELVD
jgi:hypothetical protein